eukprot:1257883-Ditylum_brightwellii.AAC.1
MGQDRRAGVQDAIRKHRPPMLRPGACAGAVFVVITDKGVYVTTTEAKWNKFVKYIEDWLAVCVDAENNGKKPEFNRKLQESGRSFVVHISRTYPAMVPYLKRIHLTLESWQAKRDNDEWNYSDKE